MDTQPNDGFTPEEYERLLAKAKDNEKIQKALSLLCQLERGLTTLKVTGNDWGHFYSISFDFLKNEVTVVEDDNIEVYPMMEWVDFYLPPN